MSFISICTYVVRTSFIDNASVFIAINIYDLKALSTFLFRSRECFEFTFINNPIMLIVSFFVIKVFEDQFKFIAKEFE